MAAPEPAVTVMRLTSCPTVEPASISPSLPVTLSPVGPESTEVTLGVNFTTRPLGYVSVSRRIVSSARPETWPLRLACATTP